MHYPVMIWPKSEEQQKLRELYAMNVNEEDLREWIVVPYEKGLSITWAGRTIPAGDFGKITITYTDARQPVPRFDEYEVIKRGVDVTNDWIKGPQRDVHLPEGARSRADRVGAGHCTDRNGIASQSGGGSLGDDQAVVVILTAEDQAGLLPDLVENGEERGLQGQPRQNVILEAGLAMGSIPTARSSLRCPIRRATDFEGLNTVRLTNESPTRASLRSRLEGAGCDVAKVGTDWMSFESGGDFDSYVRMEARKSSVGSFPVKDNSPYVQAVQLQQNHDVKRFLEMHEGIDQPFSASDLAEAIKVSEEWVRGALKTLEAEGRVRRSPTGTGWYSAGL